MSYRLPPLTAFRAFEAAARHLSFKKAAEELHVTPAAVSQQIKALEEYLGVALFKRLTRALEITSQGRAMLPKVRQGFDCLAAAVAATRQGEAGVITITAPPSFASHWLVPRLARLAADHPELRIRLASSPDAVDQPGNAPILPEQGADPRTADCEAAIRFGTGLYPGLRVDRLFAPEYLPVCSPALIAASPLLRPADLRQQVLIHDETIADGEHSVGWAEWLAAAGLRLAECPRQAHFSNAVLALDAALAGQGVALSLRDLVAADVAAGRLMLPFALTLPSPYAYFLVLPEQTAARPDVAALRDWLVAEGGRSQAVSVLGSSNKV